MQQAHLTHKYRPQRFSEVAGQESIRAILSRAAEVDSIAPAYLFSGTRGVGKTTVARILAKSINCVNAPAEEPCNECPRCRQVTKGSFVDVVEIDGASHTGVDNVRKLKEDVGYSPLEGRYKVIIIDEAHMLSKSAFNALLKTLEEPPAHVTFILATTEPHKFPPTIISRCQHFTFKRLTQRQLEVHLEHVLSRENVQFDPQALTLLARRGAGSVRDAMSLLGQVMALGKDNVREEDVRDVLGLADFETLVTIVRAIDQADCQSIIQTTSSLMDQGLDLGFFLRELAAVWRNLFMLKQCGDEATELLQIPGEESAVWSEFAASFSLAHVHACLQMTLEGQRKVLTSLEPGLSLELLLLNLAYLPRLLPVQDAGDVPAAAPKKTTPPSAQKDDSKSTPPAKSAEPKRTWKDFLAFYSQHKEDGPALPGLINARGVVQGETLHIHFPSHSLYDGLQEKERYNFLERLVKEFWGREFSINLVAPEKKKGVSMSELRETMTGHPLIGTVMDEFKAQIVEIRPPEPKEGQE